MERKGFALGFITGWNAMLMSNHSPKKKKIVKRTDRRINVINRDKILKYFKNNPDITYKTNDLIETFNESLSIKRRQILYYLSELVDNGKLLSLTRGHYTYNSDNKNN